LNRKALLSIKILKYDFELGIEALWEDKDTYREGEEQSALELIVGI
jgi:hypothetical protein